MPMNVATRGLLSLCVWLSLYMVYEVRSIDAKRMYPNSGPNPAIRLSCEI